jgi:hypothetical protein
MFCTALKHYIFKWLNAYSQKHMHKYFFPSSTIVYCVFPKNLVFQGKT